jgi:hypothetical protein
MTTSTGQTTMAGRGVLLAAAGVAAKQHDVPTAARAALELLDEYPAARQVWCAEGSTSGSVWFNRCQTPADVAHALAAVALAHMPADQVIDVTRSDDTAALLLALAAR